jgi:hypothetical protein
LPGLIVFSRQDNPCGYPRLQLATVAGDDVLVPVEGLLAQAGTRAGAIVMQVDIDKAVAFGVERYDCVSGCSRRDAIVIRGEAENVLDRG